MVDVNLYHLTVTPMEKVLPRLLEKVYDRGDRALILADTPEKVSLLNMALWTYSTKTFLPHGTREDGVPSEHPIWITDNLEDHNDPQVLAFVNPLDTFPTDKERSLLKHCKKYLDLWSGTDESSISLAQDRLAFYKGSDEYNVTCWQQDIKGRWVEVQSLTPSENGRL